MELAWDSKWPTQKFAENLMPLSTVTASWCVFSSVVQGSSESTDGQKIAVPFFGTTLMLSFVNRVSPPACARACQQLAQKSMHMCCPKRVTMPMPMHMHMSLHVHMHSPKWVPIRTCAQSWRCLHAPAERMCPRRTSTSDKYMKNVYSRGPHAE